MADQIHETAGLQIKDSGQRQQFDTGAVRDTQEGKGRFDLLPMHALEAVAQQFEAGAKKYGDRNWEKGMPLSRFGDSAMRHLAKALRGDVDEDHLRAAAWNILCMLDTRQRVWKGLLPAELCDVPGSKSPTFKIEVSWDYVKAPKPQVMPRHDARQVSAPGAVPVGITPEVSSDAVPLTPTAPTAQDDQMRRLDPQCPMFIRYGY